MLRNDAKTATGFTFVEMAIVIAILGMLMALFLGISPGMRDAQNRQIVRTKLNAIDTALVNFVALSKRLPCPADGTIANGKPNAGVETLVVATGLCGATPLLRAQTNGVIPWVTIGLLESDVTDPWGGLITYRVDPQLASNLASLMNMSTCDPAGTANVATNPPNPAALAGACLSPTTNPVQTLPCVSHQGTCTSPANFLANKGLDVFDGNPADFATRVNNRGAGTGAAYVTISHGPNVCGAYNALGTYQNQCAILANPTLAKPNNNNTPIALPTSVLTAYIDAPLNDNPINAAVHFDNYLSHPTVLSVLNVANLGPRDNH